MQPALNQQNLNMQNPFPDPDFAKEFMSLCGKIIGFITLLTAIIDAKLQKAKNAQQKRRVILSLMAIANIVVLSGSLLLFYATNFRGIAVMLFGVSTLIFCIEFMIPTGAATRREILNVVASVSALTLLVGTYFLQRLILIIESMAKVIASSGN